MIKNNQTFKIPAVILFYKTLLSGYLYLQDYFIQ